MTYSAAAPAAAVRLVSPQEVQAALRGTGEIAFLDVREEGQFGEGHPFFAVNAAYGRLELDIGALVPRLATPIVLLDEGDGLAPKAAQRLAALGYSDLAAVEGGVSAWVAAGYEVYKSVNSRLKAFAEVVEHVFHTPAIEAADLARLKSEGANLVILDSRTPEEFARFHVPGAISCPGAELVEKFDAFVRDPEQLVVVSCAGRTRGIIGAQSLIDAQVPNRVVALKGGTQGWRLAGLTLESGAVPAAPEPDHAAARARAEAVRVQYGVPLVDAATLARWRGAEAGARTTFLFDLRDAPDRAAQPVPGAVPAPGGQLVQSLDRWVGVQHARIVLIDSDGVRARLTAHWLIQLGEDVHVFEGAPGDIAEAAEAAQVAIPAVPRVSAQAAADLLKDGARALSLDASAAYRASHAAGALWTLRPRLPALPADVLAAPALVLFAADAGVADLAALDLAGLTSARIVVVEGGLAAWQGAGLPVAASPASPPDSERIDYLFWAHDRHDGNPDAMRTYLGWEEQLPGQVAAEGGGGFKLAV